MEQQLESNQQQQQAQKPAIKRTYELVVDDESGGGYEDEQQPQQQAVQQQSKISFKKQQAMQKLAELNRNRVIQARNSQHYQSEAANYRDLYLSKVNDEREAFKQKRKKYERMELLQEMHVNVQNAIEKALTEKFLPSIKQYIQPQATGKIFNKKLKVAHEYQQMRRKNLASIPEEQKQEQRQRTPMTEEEEAYLAQQEEQQAQNLEAKLAANPDGGQAITRNQARSDPRKKLVAQMFN